MQIKMIWSADPNGVIGNYKGSLVFTSKKDLRVFQELTLGNGNNAIVMGRKTFEAIGSKPLPNRFNIVMSNNVNFKLNTSDWHSNLHLAHSVNNVLDICKEWDIDTLWVIGGSEIYHLFEELANELVITQYDNYDQFPEDEMLNLVRYLPNLTKFKIFYSDIDQDVDKHTGTDLTFTRQYWRRIY